MSIVALIIALAALAGAFLSCRWNVLAAYVAMLLAWIAGRASQGASLESTPLILWGVSALIVLGLNLLLPRQTVRSRRGVAYLVTGSIAGAAIGLAIGQSWLVLGAVIGVVLGAVAYVGTPAGRPLAADPRVFISYLCEKGFPAVVTVAIAAIALFWALVAITQ